MFKQSTKTLLIVFFVLISVVNAQNKNFTLLTSTSYYGDQNSIMHKLSSLKDPYSVGLRARWNVRPDLSLQFSGEFMRGEIQDKSRKESNIYFSLSSLFYLFEGENISPFVSFGLASSTFNKDENETITKFNALMGLGLDIELISNFMLSGDIKLYSNGWNYNGIGTSLGFGYKF